MVESPIASGGLPIFSFRLFFLEYKGLFPHAKSCGVLSPFLCDLGLQKRGDVVVLINFLRPKVAGPVVSQSGAL